ncbi:DNA-packaging protein [Burkholderia cepacia]|uniref:DNA-packaging protein n=1 Tax=Burkholderia cepacia TaxID=292 RepID=UPI001CF381F0|nr:DNA-packaging protein [Burkholderia cepacia]MCA8326176.1 DNA-packaging protein [Burkholderia cepacia]
MAAPSKFKPEFVELARNYCLLGATDVDLARFFGTTDRTIRTWKQQHPEFANALDQAKEVADAQIVGALYTNALAGNVTAQIFWLKNRQPAKWRDKVDHEHAGKDGAPIQFQRVERRIIDPKSE